MSDIKLNVLVAWPYLKPDLIAMLREHRQHIRLLVDSGAFTAWKAGKVLRVGEYCDFIRSIQDIAWRYFALDVIGDPAGTRSNLDEMVRQGLRPVPIFTRGEDIGELDHLKAVSDIVAIGGLVGTKGNKGFVKGLMKYIQPSETHWLGFTNTQFVSYYKPYSCDSSSWEMGGRYARFQLYMGKGLFVPLTRADFVKMPPAKIVNGIKSYQMDPSDFSKKENWKGGHGVARVCGGRSIVRYSIELQKHMGTYHFMALTTPYALGLLLDAYKMEMNLT